MTDSWEPPGPGSPPPAAAPPPWGAGHVPAATQPWWGSPPTPATRVSPWAIATLLAGVCALLPVALVTGVVALVQVRRRTHTGRGLALGGVLAGLLWWGGIFAFGSWVMDEFEEGADYGAVSLVPDTSTGACLVQPGSGPWRAVDCDEEHDAEVVSVLEVPPGWPVPLDDFADGHCRTALYGYSDEPQRWGWFASEGSSPAALDQVVCVARPLPFQEWRGSQRQAPSG